MYSHYINETYRLENFEIDSMMPRVGAVDKLHSVKMVKTTAYSR